MADAYHLIVGLGNPGIAYAKTRHNLGWRVVRALALELGLRFRFAARLSSEVSRGVVCGKQLLLLLPSTYMNRSGEAVLAAVREFHVERERLIVVSDDAALRFGKLRMRKQGSSGGHNGLLDIEAHLGTQEYARLKIGIGQKKEGEALSDYVLAPFAEEEEKAMPQVIEEAVSVLKLWLEEGMEIAMKKLGELGE